MKFPKKLEKFFLKIDKFAPNPWIIDGVEQERPMYQFAFIAGCIIGLILALIFII